MCHPITDEDLNHCPWHTSLNVLRGLVKMKMSEPERQKVARQFVALDKTL